MIRIAGGEFMMGAVDADKAPRADELPRHRVRVDSFWIDETEVTNAQFREFVDATHYVTTAEQPVDWEKLKTQLPPGTPKPPAEALAPGALVFVPAPPGAVDYRDGWQWVPGADWKHPSGPNDSIDHKETVPVVQVSFDDASAYARWAGKSLPTEAQWEYAARGGKADEIFSWGNEPVPKGKSQANYWQGHFPTQNTVADGFVGLAPVKSFPPNGYGLFDMAGNAWEWTTDWYRTDAYEDLARAGTIAVNPKGPETGLDPDEPTVPKKTIRGGSFLCNESYCDSFRTSARMKTSPDTGAIHTGFRCVINIHGPAAATVSPSK